MSLYIAHIIQKLERQHRSQSREYSVTRDGVVVAGYTYDDDEQRIVKSGGIDGPVHYHYDSEGRLIAETNGDTGETIREYFWLGLTPIATYAASNDNTPAGESTCDEEAIAALEAVIVAQQSLIVQTEAQIADHEATTVFREGVIAAMEALLPSLSGKKYDRMIAKIANWQAKIDKLEGKIMTLEEELAVQTAELAASELELAGLQAICDGVEPGAFGLFYLHSDHLGKTQFATNDNGEVIWDGGITTPFGESVSLASAFAQNLMFPGQYEDQESGLSHNWHRTYDPTLGRYLQSDPIGLAGGINRYAYVGGNPLAWTDFTGLDASIIITEKGPDSTTGHAGMIFQDQFGNCFSYDQSAKSPDSKIGHAISRLGLLGGLPAPANVKVDIVSCDQLDKGIRIPLSSKQDHQLSQCVIKEMDDPKLYTLYGNNCAGSIASLMRCAGIPAYQPMDPRPNAIGNQFTPIK